MKSLQRMMVGAGLVIVTLLALGGESFNLSPVPNYVFREPDLQLHMEKVRSSYFGYSLNLRPGGLIVGAPRAQSDLAAQRKVNETGAIYRCSFAADAPECFPYYFDKIGNTKAEQSDFAYNSEKKDFQMLGAAMDGHGSDGDRFVVCAPKTISELVDYYLLHGICYVTDGTEQDQEPKDIRKIIPLRAKDKQLHKDAHGQYYNYMYGEQGVSVHVTDDGEEILIGAPGVFNWRGTVVRYRRRFNEDMGGLSRRDEWAAQQRPTNRHRRQIVQYVSDVPNPYFSAVKDDSYFGYAVGSGDFRGDRKTLYVASAPQSKGQVGEVFIFDIINADSFLETQIKVQYTFPGQQQGEYFGYALLAEDFNGDGFADLAIAAPMHSRSGDHDNGVVYVFWNEGELNFQLQGKLSGNHEVAGRFGTSLGRIGDINMDGYNDIAVGAPYEGNGAVYIFLGSPDGLQAKPSQKLTPPPNELLSPQPMFGFALSRGSDIDANGYKDLAIGSPNDEKVYVYRTYPVVRIEAEVTSSKRELTLEDTTFDLSICLSAVFAAGQPFGVQLKYEITVDGQVGRVTLPGVGGNRRTETITVTGTSECRRIDVRLKATAASIYKPVLVELSYELVRSLPTETGAGFCADCALLDPTVANRLIQKISFKTGCQGEVCVSDLRLSARWLDISPVYVLGSSKKASLEFEVYNAGEHAYLPQLNVTLTPARLTLAKLTSGCQQTITADAVNVLCDLNNGLPLKASYTSRYTLILDMTKLEGSSAEIKAEALSTSEESAQEDNFLEQVLTLQEFSDIEIIGKTSSSEVFLEKQSGLHNVTYEIQVHSNGPSTFRRLGFTLDVPLVYHKPSSGQSYKIISFNNIVVSGYYNYKTLDYTWTQNDTILLPNPIEHDHIVPPTVDVEDMHRLPSDFDLLSGGGGAGMGGFASENQPHGYDQSSMGMHRRRRRGLGHGGSPVHTYNRYTGQLSGHSRVRRSLSKVNDATVQALPANRTLFFNCAQEDAFIECARLNVAVDIFRPTNVPIIITLQFQLDLDAIGEAFLEREDIFALMMLTDVHKVGDPDGVTYRQVRSNPFTVVYRYADGSTPIWVYIVSALGGLLLLVAISYGMYRAGFFKRTTKEEMEKLHRESTRLNEPEQGNQSPAEATTELN
ncbi:integrin alpha-PS3-like [Anopheles stephensi]|uniref:integrin alpha-PS3-like n=1 Tax=Anopheles stephensi TaxID=30069 RepID=UPI0016587F6E|nr:integrin alpha-PS3-like [Anopheles stephensi]XP_035895347.1 integrin alpha-PS3-like [Anopheles stephensi]XP_035895348.1 integrin alpha-PS3-like [Anopheles stephensi]XP_035895349.1 integrin alpha-PS3-like [Anopheles stephensi]